MKTGKSTDSAICIQSSECMTKGFNGSVVFCIFPHRYNKWIYSISMGECINQQRCCIVRNATINHSGLMSGRGKGQ